VKHKERKEPLGITESKGIFGGLSISVGGGGKFVEHDDVSSRCPSEILV
jgi:sorting nexin-1/2